MSNRFYKKPAEEFPVSVEFVNSLPDGTTVVSGTISAIDEHGTDVSATCLDSTTLVISGSAAKAEVKGGTDGDRVNLKFLVTLNDGSKLQENVVMLIADE